MPENSRLVAQAAPKTKSAGVSRSFTPRFLYCSQATWWPLTTPHASCATRKPERPKW